MKRKNMTFKTSKEKDNRKSLDITTGVVNENIPTPNKKIGSDENILTQNKKIGSDENIPNQIKVITKLPNSEQSYKGKVQTHNYINRQNQSTTGKL